jgi:hypothetical protein
MDIAILINGKNERLEKCSIAALIEKRNLVAGSLLLFVVSCPMQV